MSLHDIVSGTVSGRAPAQGIPTRSSSQTPLRACNPVPTTWSVVPSVNRILFADFEQHRLLEPHVLRDDDARTFASLPRPSESPPAHWQSHERGGVWWKKCVRPDSNALGSIPGSGVRTTVIESGPQTRTPHAPLTLFLPRHIVHRSDAWLPSRGPQAAKVVEEEADEKKEEGGGGTVDAESADRGGQEEYAQADKRNCRRFQEMSTAAMDEFCGDASGGTPQGSRSSSSFAVWYGSAETKAALIGYPLD
uniref:Uncharacterized protein n=1 Tax=Mycena chlorophos TaxID=658473 RepID=A0ABQ0KXY5_MYCCL|nr:predicted protein [Mycena chlorophos]